MKTREETISKLNEHLCPAEHFSSYGNDEGDKKI